MLTSELYINSILENKVVKVFDKPNYVVDDYESPPKKDIQKDPKTGKDMYRRKIVFDKNGKKNILTFAIMKGKGKFGGKTQLTSKVVR